jgi:TolB-like protein
VPVTPWARIKEHKIIQWAIGYLAAALALTHAQELIAHAYGWPESIGQILIAVLGIGLPVAVTLAWYHGHRASRHVTGAEASILAVLLLIGSGLLWALVRPHEPAVAPSVVEHANAPTTPPVASAAVPLTSASSAAPLVPTPVSGKPRIAILPFVNLSPDPANAFFTDGLHEEIISTLSSRARGLEVISRTTMMTYRTPKPAPEIARELGATHVLEGSVRRAGKRVRLTLQLIAARADDHIWSQDYDRTLTDALTLQSDVANEVASQLSLQLAPSAASPKRLTRNPEAYDFYLKAMLDADSQTFWNPRRDVFRRVDELLGKAIERDPDFAAAYARRAQYRMHRVQYNFDPEGLGLRLGRQDLEAAEALAPNDPVVSFVKGAYLEYVDKDRDGALAAFAAADAAGLADARSLASSATTLLRAGHIAEALDRYERAMTLDPRGTYILVTRTFALMSARRPADALRVIDFAAGQEVEVGGFRSRAARDFVVWRFTGSGQALSDMAIHMDRFEITGDVDAFTVNGSLVPLLYQHRYGEMLDFLGNTKAQIIRSGFPMAGNAPVAELRGWVHLLMGNRAAAAQDGHEVLNFVANSRKTKWNRMALHVLTAEGDTLSGDTRHAVAAAREALSVAQYPDDRRDAAAIIARVYAWAGAEDEAVTLLEQFSTEIPMTLSPTEIARDPRLSVPLAGSARYKALQAKLEAQMAATKLE